MTSRRIVELFLSMIFKVRIQSGGELIQARTAEIRGQYPNVPYRSDSRSDAFQRPIVVE